MEFEKSKYSKILNYYKIEKPFGNFYLCEHFFIAELSEGIHFDWKMIENVSVDLIDYYGNKTSLGYISNRINSYSIDPHFWNKIDKKYGIFTNSAIVYYNEMMYMNATLEKQFSNINIKRCISLEEAINWVLEKETNK
ncbi:hypothetical protein APS56_01670 [Pseudalgibacter alginicilyticus]|uniref:STAS/SEC14 domain-containing protein n=1 Tax=Pseudalgibacter alginicilyticus TaxID=1736674 RepID=A0A0P0D814_9FLAO|nr:hypothetical protein [Pseudalgibacter alginicilyticus]ALJ03935.1 hypothetical protein APS56_01670 [Pseudalgibacter alginicilyticus]